MALPIDRVLSGGEHQTEYMEDLQERLHKYHKLAKTNMDKAQWKQNKYCDAKRLDVKYNIGDEVLLRTYTDHFAAKLAQRWAGPNVIHKLVNEFNYELHSNALVSLGVQHVLNLRPYRRLEGMSVLEDKVQGTGPEGSED